ncbi:MAG: hypothetical protein NDJ89_09460 [Oligoflexia bacterium]|nr:hypothetical protein [Oligoflexia bacterium]
MRLFNGTKLLSLIFGCSLAVSLGASAVEVPQNNDYTVFVNVPRMHLKLGILDRKGKVHPVRADARLARSVRVKATRTLAGSRKIEEPLKFDTFARASKGMLELQLRYTRGSRGGSFRNSDLRLEVSVGERSCQVAFDEPIEAAGERTLGCLLL